MHLYVYLECYKGIVDKLRVNPKREIIDQCEQKFLNQNEYASKEEYEDIMRMQGGLNQEYHIFEVELEE